MSKVQTHEIEIRVPVEDAWRALTEPDELVRWFAEEARVEPREGGASRAARSSSRSTCSTTGC